MDEDPGRINHLYRLFCAINCVFSHELRASQIGEEWDGWRNFSSYLVRVGQAAIFDRCTLASYTHGYPESFSDSSKRTVDLCGYRSSASHGFDQNRSINLVSEDLRRKINFFPVNFWKRLMDQTNVIES